MYNLVQFLGFSWVFVNLTVRLFILGQGVFGFFSFDRHAAAGTRRRYQGETGTTQNVFV